MARARKASDDVYNARRRFRRQAERYIQKMEGASGLTKARYEAQARNAVMNAMRTYSGGQKPQGQVAKLAERLNVTQGSIVARSALKGAQGTKVRASEVNALIQRSFTTLSGAETSNRDNMAREILSSGNIGSRFYGGLVQIWDGSEESRQHPNQAILDFFGKSSLMDVIEELEEQGIDLYAPDENDDVYKSAQLQLQKFVLQTRRLNARKK